MSLALIPILPSLLLPEMRGSISGLRNCCKKNLKKKKKLLLIKKKKKKSCRIPEGGIVQKDRSEISSILEITLLLRRDRNPAGEHRRPANPLQIRGHLSNQFEPISSKFKSKRIFRALLSLSFTMGTLRMIGT